MHYRPMLALRILILILVLIFVLPMANFLATQVAHIHSIWIGGRSVLIALFYNSPGNIFANSQPLDPGRHTIQLQGF